MMFRIIISLWCVISLLMLLALGAYKQELTTAAACTPAQALWGAQALFWIFCVLPLARTGGKNGDGRGWFLFFVIGCGSLLSFSLLSGLEPMSLPQQAEYAVSLLITVFFFLNLARLLPYGYFTVLCLAYACPLLIKWLAEELFKAKYAAAPDWSWLTNVNPLYIHITNNTGWWTIVAYLVAGVVLFIINNTSAKNKAPVPEQNLTWF